MIVFKLLFLATAVTAAAMVAKADRESDLPFKADYIDLNLTTGLETTLYDQDPSDIVVEIALVTEKRWSDLFQQDRRKIQDYLSVLFYDINLRYQTLPSVNISLRVTSITIIANVADQPFIEESRGPVSGISFPSALVKFGDWIAVQLEQGAIPKYDVALLVTHEGSVEGYSGLAFVSTACSPSRAVGVTYDRGHFLDRVVAAHEMAHILGAGHDSSYDWCTERGFIMGGDDINRENFFSSCSDRVISEFVKTDRAACLRRIDAPGTPPIEVRSAAVTPPSVLEQCRQAIRDPNAVVQSGDEGKCQDIWCLGSPDVGGNYFRMNVYDNTVCAGRGRCFRGRCLRRGYKLINVATRECVLGADRFEGRDSAVMGACPQYPTPMQKFSFANYSEGYGPFLSVPYSTRNADENTDKCLWIGQGEGSEVGFDTCTRGHVPSYEWDVELTDFLEQYLLVHVHTGKCAKQVGASVRTYQDCDKNDPFMRWSFYGEIQ